MIGSASPKPKIHKGRQMDEQQRQMVALFRYALVRQATDEQLTPRQRGALVRALAAQDHLGVDGQRVRVSRATLDRWILAWHRGGFEALKPVDRNARARTSAQMLELAVALKQEVPRRTAAQVAAIVKQQLGAAPSARNLQRHFARLGLNTKGPATLKRTFGRFEAEAPNQLWTGDVLHGPVVAGRRSYLFAFIDDHSRLLVGYRFGVAEDALRLEAALRAALACRGIPKALYVDNGSPFVSRQLLRACAVLGIRLVHSAPGQPEGRGKIERFFRTVRDQFLVEVTGQPVTDLDQLNSKFQAWVETIYHRRTHSETSQTPLERYQQTEAAPVATPEQLREAFLWSEQRSVTKTATVSLWGNTYEVDAHLAGHKVELMFNPFDLSRVRVRWRGKDLGEGLPHTIRRHSHPKARPEPAVEVPPTGIDYLGLVEQSWVDSLKRRISYTGLQPENQNEQIQPNDDDQQEGNQP
jgi:putative transposase